MKEGNPGKEFILGGIGVIVSIGMMQANELAEFLLSMKFVVIDDSTIEIQGMTLVSVLLFGLAYLLFLAVATILAWRLTIDPRGSMLTALRYLITMLVIIQLFAFASTWNNRFSEFEHEILRGGDKPVSFSLGHSKPH